MSSDSAQQQEPVGRIVALGGDSRRLEELLPVVRSLGHDIAGHENGSDVSTENDGSPEADAWAEIDVVVILADEHDQRWISEAKKVHRDSAAPPIVVLGPPTSGWRRQALKAGAFLCGSVDAPDEDLQALLSAAIRYRSVVKENNFLRVECERICMGLLKSYGEAASSLKETTEEVESLQRNLSEIRSRIIRAFV